MQYCFRIFGCQMNYADSERVKSVLAESDWEETTELEQADAILLFTCSVRQKAEDKVFGLLQDLQKWKARSDKRRIGLTGCMVRQTSSQADPKRDSLLKRSDVLDFVWRIEDSKKLPKLLLATGNSQLVTGNSRLVTGNYFSIRPYYKNKFSVFVPISTGCDNYCSYCIVPYARGREISRSEKEILKECQQAVENSAQEITLLGQNVNSYQKKKGAFAKLLAKVAKISKLKRIRFISSHPKDFDETVIDVMATNANIERHLHLPAQHGDNSILKKMNRNYTAGQYLKLVEKFRQKLSEASVTTDFIVGFPEETEKQFENLLKFYREASFDFAFFAKYSPRPGTAAAKLSDDVSRSQKSERWNRLNDLMIATTTKKYAALKNKVLEVLVESCRNGECAGRSSEFYLTKFKGKKDLVGKMVKAKITQTREVELIGEIIEN
ncbi:MAG: tRNA (N6-isopentenyl adenosine(37)-C2)-methylthiotransferase MiaB [Patescibacteria group bacterium]